MRVHGTAFVRVAGPTVVAPTLAELPRYLVLNPSSTIRIELRLESSSCEIDVEPERPRPGRSFILLLGPPGGPFVQRVRLSGRARIYFDPEAPGRYELLLANPDREPLTLHLRARNMELAESEGGGRSLRPTIRHRAVATAGARRHRTPARRRARSDARSRAA
jgi:hypothetical protein